MNATTARLLEQLTDLIEYRVECQTVDYRPSEIELDTIRNEEIELLIRALDTLMDMEKVES